MILLENDFLPEKVESKVNTHDKEKQFLLISFRESTNAQQRREFIEFLAQAMRIKILCHLPSFLESLVTRSEVSCK